jgi:mannose-6-phosphate isomerase-like protein (cupin superfamily)
MKRRLFLQFPLLAVPLVLEAQTLQVNRPKKGFKVEAGKDRFNDKNFFTLTGGSQTDCKVSTSDTNGDLYIMESFRRTKGGPRLHFHYSQDEWLYVLEGEHQAKVGADIYNLKPGDSLFMPRKVPHQFTNVKDSPGRLIILYQPAGKMEAFFKALSAGVTDKFSEDELNKFAQDYGMENVGLRRKIE